MRLLSVLAGLAGLTLLSVLVAHVGLDAVIRPLVAVGWSGLAAICAIHLGLLAAMGIAWGFLIPGARLWVPIWGRLVRDAGSELLPLSQIGGYVVGARAVSLAGVPGTAATASTIVDVTLELFGQLLYTALGLLFLMRLRPDATIATPVLLGLAAAGLLAVGFFSFQRRGLGFLDRCARMLGRGWADKTAAGAVALQSALSDIYGRRARVFSSFGLHLACWIAGTLEAWAALRFAGVSLAFAPVLVIESLLYAARSVAFAVPNAVGIQEGAYILLGASFGLTPEVALALSLIKRARDLVLGLPAVAAWQLVESGRLWHRAGVAEGRRSGTPVATTGVPPSSAGCVDRAMSITNDA